MSLDKRKEWIYVGLPAEIVKLIDEVIAAKNGGSAPGTSSSWKPSKCA